MRTVIWKLANDQDGAALVEYGMLVGLIAVICIVAVTNTGTKISKLFQRVAATLPS